MFGARSSGRGRCGVPDRLLVDLGGDGQVEVLAWPDEGMPERVSRAPLTWPLDADALQDLRWYLEDYLLAPFGVWEDRGPSVQEKLAGWGDQVLATLEPTVLKRWEALLPRKAMATMHTTAISATRSAYSTREAPRSSRPNRARMYGAQCCCQ